MRVVLLLEPLLAGRPQVVAPDGDYVVAAVGRRVIDGLVFTHEEEGNGRGEATEGPRVGADVDVVPGARVRQAGLQTAISGRN